MRLRQLPLSALREVRVFRWAGPRVGLRALAGGDVTVTITGDLPIKDLKDAPCVVVLAGPETLLQDVPGGRSGGACA